ncbi:MAG: hypothetical protein KKA42_14455, partial [candidate division Zixibacteria bacterium]|nr:hypothetical protein [candidate division Zixibacteria bacterium]
TPWFQANLDTYGGNSGSMVVNTGTWVIEGILVRGAPDFVNGGGCTESNQVPNTGNPGSGLEFEEVSKTVTFASYIPELVNSSGEITFGRALYSCNDSALVDLRDTDLAGLGTYSVDVTSTSGDVESVLLSEEISANGVFTGYLATSGDAVSVGDGVLQVVDGAKIITEYADADDGTGSPAVAGDTATADCLSPVISGVTIVSAEGTRVTVSFNTNEPAVGRGEVGISCGVPTSSAQSAASTLHIITVSGLSPVTAYTLAVEASDAAGNSARDDNGGMCYDFTTAEQADYFTELFSGSDNDLGGFAITFSPDSSADSYEACTDSVSGYLTDPYSGTSVTLSDDDAEAVALTDGKQVSLYGTAYGTVYIGGNGYLTFGSPDTDYSETVAEHFGGPPRVAALWDDLNPSVGGTVSYVQLDDRFVVTWDSVQEFSSGNLNSFQAELYYDGTIKIVHLDVNVADGLIGLAEGGFNPDDFIESDMSSYPTCTVVPPSCCVGSKGDIVLEGNCEARDGVVDVGDLTALIDHLFGTFSALCCEESADVAPLAGPQDGVVDVGDLTAVIDHLFITFPALPSCN